MNVNHARYQGQPGGFYESYFLRANHPDRPLAFWLRYTLFVSRDPGAPALGEVWAVWFDGERSTHVVAKEEYPLGECRFDTDAFHVTAGASTLQAGRATGAVALGGARLAWDLAFTGDAPPLLLLPARLYAGRFPAAKSLVSLPMARFSGALEVDGERIDISDWTGSQNHNWGTRHTDLYAWGQVAGFDTHPDSFLELATARLRIGPAWTPPMTVLVLRHAGREHALTGLLRAVRARGRFDYFHWRFRSRAAAIEISGEISAPRETFVGLNYYNPPGGARHCLNSKLARCRLELRDLASGRTEVLEAAHRAAFEILTEDRAHGVRVRA